MIWGGLFPGPEGHTIPHISRLGFATPEMRVDRTGIAASETPRRPRGLRNEIVSGLCRLYGTSETRPETGVPERLGDSASCPPQSPSFAIARPVRRDAPDPIRDPSGGHGDGGASLAWRCRSGPLPPPASRGRTRLLPRRRASCGRNGGVLGLGGRRPFSIVKERLSAATTP